MAFSFPSLAAVAALMASGTAALPPLVGLWGGRGVSLEATAEGARLQESCSDIAFAPLRPNRAGRFSVVGRSTAYGAGPQRADEEPATERVTATGRIDGDTLIMTVKAGSAPVRELRLKRGLRAKVIRCM